MGSNSTVAKNTLFLYTRTLVTVGVSLYATRIVLATLGVVDFGVYNVIGGFVAMFTFLTSTMSAASTRFFAFELGKGDLDSQRHVFKVTFTIYLILIAAILLIAETVGLWVVAKVLVIPPERMTAAMAVYQYSVLSMIFSILRIPFNAAFIAHERMGFFAYTSVIESVLKLLIVFLLVWIPLDKLELYAALTAIVTGAITAVYWLAARKFSECRVGIEVSGDKMREILSYSGWNLFGNFGDIFVDQGMNILLNVVFGPVVNAARGIAYNVKSILINFVTGFQMAAQPQITMHYASGRLSQMDRLVLQTSKLSFLLMLVLTVPAFFCAEWVLRIWLPEVPPYSVLFTRLLMIEILFLSMGGTFHMAINATGHISRFIIYLTLPKILCFGLAYAGLKFCNFPPEYVIWLCILSSLLCAGIKFAYYRKFFYNDFISEISPVIVRETIVLCSAAAVTAVFWFTVFDSASTVSVLATSSAGFIVAAGLCYTIGLNSDERDAINRMIISRLPGK